MADLFDFAAKRRRFAVVGNPVAHSLSPRIHQLFARQFGLTMEYHRLPVEVGGFAAAVGNFFARAGAGLNVTAPFKQQAFKLCAAAGNAVSERARWAEAVNTIQFKSEQKLFGDNTDGVGLRRDLENNLNWKIAGQRVLILGAGGAARGIILPLLQHTPASITIANRTAHKARKLAEQFSAAGDSREKLRERPAAYGCGYERLAEFMAAATDARPNFATQPNFDLVINATAASLQQQSPVIDAACIRGAMVYDLAYAHPPTVFMKWALANGARAVSDGLGMLVEQAAESFYLWHQRRADTGAVLAALRKSY